MVISFFRDGKSLAKLYLSLNLLKSSSFESLLNIGTVIDLSVELFKY